MPTLTELDQKVRAALDAAGYDVKGGRADLFDIAGTDRLVPAFNTCFGNNPAAPYIVPAVPHGPGEVYDYGKSMLSENENDDGEPLYWTYRLEEHEAILVFGNLPPEAAFIGYETFLFTRYFDGKDPLSPEMDWLSHAVGVQRHLSHNPDNLLYDHAPIADGSEYTDNPNRVTLFANGPTINRRNLERKIGDEFWGQQAIFSTSPDAGFEAALNAQLGSALAGLHLHSPLGADLKLGLTDHGDDFWTLMRYAVPKDRDAAEAWRTAVAEQLLVLRVSKRTPTESVVRHPTYEFEEKTANTDERYLAADLQTVADAVSSQLGFGEGSSQEVCLPLSSFLHTPLSVPLAMSAVGATNDADYRASAALDFGSEEVLAVVGVNHTRTDNSTYVSLGIYEASIWKGIRGISQALEYPDPGILHDSAQKFFESLGGVPAGLAGIDLSKFYVHVLARPSADLDEAVMGSTFCTVIYETDDPDVDDELVLASGEKIRITERAYLNPDPNASCGPDHKKLLSMILLAKGTDSSSKRAKPGRRSSR